jgi:hypothetical protein
MASSIKDNPGPGEYNTSGGIALPLQVKKDSNHGLASISYSKSMPSMPPKRDPKLIRYTGRGSDRPGPADTKQDASRNQRTTDFHASPTQRTLFAHNVSIDNFMPHPGDPAPGLYKTTGEIHRGKGIVSAFKSLTPQVPQPWLKDGPGPGTYHDEASDGAEEKALPHGSFRSASGRGQSWQSVLHPYTHPDFVYKVPGPGKYPSAHGFAGEKTRRARHSSDPTERKFHGVHQPHQMIALRDTDGLKLWGFDTSDERSCNKPDRDNGVPSLAYNIEDSMGQSMKSNIKELGKNGKTPFTSSADRFARSFASVSTGDCPGPGEHQNIEKKSEFYNMKGEPSASGFRSGTARLPRDPAEKEAMQKPSPGSYEAFDKVNYRNKFRQPKSQHLSFGSGGSRWNPNEVFSGKKHTPNPGPGEYSPRLSVGNVALGNIGSTNRDLSVLPRVRAPGPGQYDSHGTTMHIMTYNVTGPDAARRAHGYYQNSMEPPNIGGGAGGGITGTRSRLGEAAGGAGANAAQIDAMVRERGKVKKQGTGSVSSPQSETPSPKRTTSPKGVRIVASDDHLSPAMKTAVGTAFVTEPIGLAKGWTLGKATSPVHQATSQPEEQGEQKEQQQQESAQNATSDTVEGDKPDPVEKPVPTDTETIAAAVEAS